MLVLLDDVLPDQDVLVALSADGLLSRAPVAGLDKRAVERLGSDALTLVRANTRQDLYLFTVKGQAARVPVHQIPDSAKVHFADVCGLTRRDRVASLRTSSRSSKGVLWYWTS